MKTMYLMHARVLTPPIFIAQDPHIPSLQDLLNVKVGSISFLILIKASRTMGPHLQNTNINNIGKLWQFNTM